jgi:hypothetical protein
MEKEHNIAQSPSESEKGGAIRHASAGDGNVPTNFREQDFLTRNGLNLKSFQRRKQLSVDACQTDRVQATGELPSPSWIDP